MKLRRMISTMLALLLMVSLLPVAALAEDNIDSDTIITENIDTNYGKNVTVGEGVIVQTNAANGEIVTNTGAIVTNTGGIFNNKGTVGSYTDAECKTPDPNTGNKGRIVGNTGTIVVNDRGIVYNGAGATDLDDDFAMDKRNLEPDATVVVNKGEIATNIGKVTTNAEGSIISSNGGYVGTNDKGAVVDYNNGMIGENRGTVNSNEVQVEYDADRYDFVPKFGTNDEPIPAVITKNSGTVEENYGTVETNAIDGVVNNHYQDTTVKLSVEDAATSEKKRVVLEGKVENNFGTVNDVDGKTYYGLSWGDNVQSLTLIDGRMPGDADPVDLNDYAAKASRSGYRMTGFTAYSRVDGADKLIEKPSGHVMNAPVWLYIMWQELGGTGEPQPTRTPVYANLSADQVRVGTFIRLGGCVFKIIEVNDDSIRVATVNKLPGEALTDMLGFLKQYLSDAQIAKLTGEPELLEQELVAKFFGGSNEHIAFYAARDLFA